MQLSVHGEPLKHELILHTLLQTHRVLLSVIMLWLFWATQELMERPGTRRLFVTRILKQFECDTFLPEISPDKYRLLPE